MPIETIYINFAYKLWDFWDIAGPLSLVVYAMVMLLSIYGWRKGKPALVFIGSTVGASISLIFIWSIGKYLIIAPIILVVLFSIYSWRKKASLSLFLSAILSVLISYFFFWSIGKYIVIVPILQLIATIYILIINAFAK
ncbi:hypothetical protein AB1399_01030 [Hydrogenibacillus schlegelii]|uniref:hypothetical protein n=1 Tax=Hydrogenibacillus schlegelii TaxID=1484 RepID=UPI0012E36BBA|nr:hypothetical protein [Hydrogenibacillus schlegelii]